MPKLSVDAVPGFAIILCARVVWACPHPGNLCAIQAQLVEQIGSMLSSFTQRKTEEVRRTVASIHSQLDSSRHAVGSSFAELATLSASAAGHFQVGLSLSHMHFNHCCCMLLAVPRCVVSRDQAVGACMLLCRGVSAWLYGSCYGQWCLSLSCLQCEEYC